MTDTDSRDVSLTIPARPDYLVLARLALSAVCRLTPLSAEEIADLKLAITEAANDFVDESRGRDGAGPQPGDHRGDRRRGRLRDRPHAPRQVPLDRPGLDRLSRRASAR